jgi:hypothetical protein
MLSSGVAPTTVRSPLVMVAVDLRGHQKGVRRQIESLENDPTVVHVLSRSGGSHAVVVDNDDDDDDDDDDNVTRLVLKHKLDNAKSA